MLRPSGLPEEHFLVWLSFHGMDCGLVEIPLRFYLGVLPVTELLPFILLQCGWTLVFIITGIIILKAGMRRVVVQGG